MLLSDEDLTGVLEAGELTVEPLADGAVQPASVEVRLGKRFRVFNNHQYGVINPRERQHGLTTLVELAGGQPFILHPGEFALGATLEMVRVEPCLAARLEGKSSLGRLGLVVHSTAGWVDPGFEGRITLELSNANTAPIMLWPGDPIGQLCVFRLSRPARWPYGAPGRGSRYQGQDAPTESRSWLRWAENPVL